MDKYKLVPVEPTPDMLAAGHYAIEAGCHPSGIYADMLAAAPSAHGSLSLSDEKILEIASNPMSTPCSPWWLKGDVKAGDVQNAAIAFAKAVLKAATPVMQVEPVAWMHSDPGRVDVIHDKVRKLLKDSSDNAGYLHRPLDKSERYTIPLYTAPQPAEQQPSAHWSHDNPGLADQYRGEAMAARRSVGFKQDADDVSPTDISAAIESLTRTAAPAVQMEVVGWQFYLDGKWWNGDDRIKDHKRNTQEAGYRIRDVYAFSDGPTLVEECPLVETLESIAEYWNQDGNEDAMLNACEYTRSAALAALAAYRKQGDGQ